MDNGSASFQEIEMRGKPYTFVVSLYCTLMVASAFMTIDRHEQSLAGIGAPVAEAVQAQLQKAAAVLPGGAVDVPARPSNAVGQPVAMAQDSNGVTFKQVTDIVASKGVNTQISAHFCQLIGINSGGQPWPIKYKEAAFPYYVRSVSLGTVDGKPTVVLIDRTPDSKQGAIYVTDTDGNLIRAYNSSNGVITRTPDSQPTPGLGIETSFWIAWLPSHTAVVTADATRR